jgi:hypothetical protein
MRKEMIRERRGAWNDDGQKGRGSKFKTQSSKEAPIGKLQDGAPPVGTWSLELILSFEF